MRRSPTATSSRGWVFQWFLSWTNRNVHLEHFIGVEILYFKLEQILILINRIKETSSRWCDPLLNFLISVLDLIHARNYAQINWVILLLLLSVYDFIFNIHLQIRMLLTQSLPALLKGSSLERKRINDWLILSHLLCRSQLSICWAHCWLLSFWLVVVKLIILNVWWKRGCFQLRQQIINVSTRVNVSLWCTDEATYLPVRGLINVLRERYAWRIVHIDHSCWSFIILTLGVSLNMLESC